jgi:hypothetical protein
MTRLVLSVNAGDGKNVVSSTSPSSNQSSGVSAGPSVKSTGPTDGEMALRILDVICAEVGPEAKCRPAK